MKEWRETTPINNNPASVSLGDAESIRNSVRPDWWNNSITGELQMGTNSMDTTNWFALGQTLGRRYATRFNAGNALEFAVQTLIEGFTADRITRPRSSSYEKPSSIYERLAWIQGKAGCDLSRLFDLEGPELDRAVAKIVGGLASLLEDDAD